MKYLLIRPLRKIIRVGNDFNKNKILIGLFIMRNILKFGKIILPVLALLFTACQDDIVTYNDGYDNGLTPSGPPSISKIILAKDTASQPTVIEGASLATMIAIYGENLSQVTSVRFNDVETDLKQVYAVNSRIIVPVPRVLPEEIDDKLTITTTKGNVSTIFYVSVPDLLVEGLENEFATAGDTVRITGDYFDLYDVTEEKGAVTINGRSMELLEADETSLTVVIPEGTPDNSVITVTGPKVENPVSVKFRDFGFTVLTFEGLWGDWVPMTDGTNEGDPKPLSGVPTFLRLNADLEAWDWDPGRIYGGGFNFYDEDVVSHPENYYFKFEINTGNPISVGNIIMNLNGEYKWNPADGGISFDTKKKWKTIRMDLKELGWALTTNPAWNGLSIVYQPTDATSADISIANARIVKK